jgi:hypothetical protein
VAQPGELGLYCNKIRVKIDAIIEVRVRISTKVIMEVEWLPSIMAQYFLIYNP